MAEIIVPVLPGVFSAFGLLISEMREEQIQTWLQPLASTDPAELRAQFDALEQEAAGRLGVTPGGRKRHRVNRRLQLRFRGQSHSIPIELPAGPIRPDAVTALFHDAHRRLYGYTFADQPLEIVNLWAVVTLKTKPTATPPYVPEKSSAKTGERPVYLEGRVVATPIYHRFSLPPGAVIPGPAILEQPDTTTLVLPRQQAGVDAQGNLVLRTRSKAKS